ncbi:MAG: UvrB/UvrC motif-containing protein [Verrucomicrobiota bacterium]
MNLDLNTLLEGWPHEPGQIRVRKIKGNDGKEKIQLRLDLGLIQMETADRPDGARPHGRDSLLTWHRERAEAAAAQGGTYTLNGDDCGELHQEGVQYYHRYLALFQLEDFAGVVRDTQHNLELFTLISRHAEREEMAWSFEQFRPYVLMMHTRAKASLELERGNIAGAIEEIERSRDRILEMVKARPEPAENCPEVEFLNEWLQELRTKRPLSKLEILQREMDRAVEAEAYERAAELRDAIRAFRANETSAGTQRPKRPRKPKTTSAAKGSKPSKASKEPKAEKPPKKRRE